MPGIKEGRFARRNIPRGKTTEVHLKVSETVTHKPARIPITLVRGNEDGPVLFLTAAVHGDEINGTAIVRRVLDDLEPDDIRGTLVALPVVNRFGFPSGDRYLPDRRDLNRFFPGNRDGSMASRIANHVFQKIVRQADAGIDIHTAAQGRSNLCHIRGDASDDKVRDLMRAFGTPILIDTPGDRGTLRRAATEAGIPVILYEAGEPDRFQHHVVEIGHQGVLRVMHHLGMLDRRPRKPPVQVLMRSSDWIRADHGGVVDLAVEPGDLVRKGQRLGTIHDPFGRRVDKMLAPNAGVVLSVSTNPRTNPGTALVHLGKLDKTLPSVRDYVKAGGDLGHVNWSRWGPVPGGDPPAAKKALKLPRKPGGAKRVVPRAKPGAGGKGAGGSAKGAGAKSAATPRVGPRKGSPKARSVPSSRKA